MLLRDKIIWFFCVILAAGLLVAAGTQLDYINFEQAKKLIDNAAANGQWIILISHDVGQSKHNIGLRGDWTTNIDTLEGVCKYIKDPANGLLVGTVEEIGKYIIKQRAAAVTKQTKSQ